MHSLLPTEMMRSSCRAAGYNECCIPTETELCEGNTADCFCEKGCIDYEDCCEDFFEICVLSSSSTIPYPSPTTSVAPYITIHQIETESLTTTHQLSSNTIEMSISSHIWSTQLLRPTSSRSPRSSRLIRPTSSKSVPTRVPSTSDLLSVSGK